MSGDHNEGVHLFPFRTQKLSPLVPMVLFLSGDGRVGSCRAFFIPSYLYLYPNLEWKALWYWYFFELLFSYICYFASIENNSYFFIKSN